VANYVHGLLLLAKGLKKSVVFEGVQTRQQLDSLVAVGATYVQGDYFGKPAALKQLAKSCDLNGQLNSDFFAKYPW